MSSIVARVFTISLLVALPGAVALAQQPPPDIPEEGTYTPREPLPPKQLPEDYDEQLEPQVIIREEEDRRVEEYRLDGRVYMVKVTPDHGVPYYYMDADGDGSLELQDANRMAGPTAPAMWRIKEW